jgi:hypothetical protein
MSLLCKIFLSSAGEDMNKFFPFLNLIVPRIFALPFRKGIKAPTKLISSFQTIKVSEILFPGFADIAGSPSSQIIYSLFSIGV